MATALIISSASPVLATAMWVNEGSSSGRHYSLAEGANNVIKRATGL